jgi:hypothetical protein
MAERATYTGGNFNLDINGFNAGYLKKVSGMGMVADIAENKLGPDNVVKKHVAKIKWEPAKIEVGIGMGAELYKWIKAAFDKQFIYKDGTLSIGDFNHKSTARKSFFRALITEVTIPKLDGGDKNPAYFTVGFQPETVRMEPGDNNDIRAPIGPAQKAWLCSNFRVEIGSLPCNRVSSVDSFTLKCSTAFDDIGIFRESTLHPAAVAVPDIKVTWSYADHDELEKHAKKWFVDGNHLEGDEMTGRIVFLGPNMKDELGEIVMENMGWKSFKDDDAEGGSDKIKRCTGEFYVERMRFNIKKYDA